MKAMILGLGILLAIPAVGFLSPYLSGDQDISPVPTTGYAPRPFSGQLDVMTYNVHGLPWPIALGRPAQLAAIGDRLRRLHEAGRAPDVVVLQEAFTPEARMIGKRAGYRYVVFGAGASDRVDAPVPPDAQWQRLLAGSRWTRGEAIGRILGSGLAILSDFPITNVRKMTYTRSLCAGFDCLAAKGALIVQVSPPGTRGIEIATTHMNSRAAAAVPAPRSDLAWQEQGRELTAFIAANRNPMLPLILGGDLNVGRSLPRRQGIAELVTRLGSGAIDALHILNNSGIRLSADARHELVHAKDWELSLEGIGKRLVPQQVSVPFGADRGKALSDHYGYAIRFALEDCAGNSAIGNGGVSCRQPEYKPS